MSNQPYKAIVFDLFDTIVTWDPSGLELVTWRGREMRTTMPLLFPLLDDALGESFDREQFMTAHFDVYQEIFAERSSNEIGCSVTFRAGLPGPPDPRRP